MNLETNPTQQLLALQSINDAAVFFTANQPNNYLNLLVHLSRYSNLFLTVTGAPGSGKTHLKNQFVKQLDSGVKLISLNAQQFASLAEVMASLANALNFETYATANEETFLAEIKSYCASLNEEGGSLLIVIDDAENLTQDTLELLVKLATLTDDSLRPHVALFGTAKLLEGLSAPAIKATYEKVAHHLPLEAFSLEQTQAYLEHRCQSVGIDSLPLSQAEVLAMHQQAEGLAGQLNKLLLAKFQQLAQAAETITPEPAVAITTHKKVSKKKLSKTKQPSNNKALPLWLILALSVTLALFVLAVIYQDSFFVQETVLVEEEWTPPSQLNLAKLAELEDLADDLPTPTNEADLADAKPIEAEETKVGLDLPDDSPQAAQSPVPVKTPEPKKLKTPAKKQPEWQDRGFQKEASLLAKKPENYTLQVLGSHDKSHIDAFINQQSFATKQLLSYFSTSRNGKPWFVLIYGEYPNIDAARNARSSLEKSLQDLKPWPRSFKDVQNLIQQN